jgi:hypothetical protein
MNNEVRPSNVRVPTSERQCGHTPTMIVTNRLEPNLVTLPHVFSDHDAQPTKGRFHSGDRHERKDPPTGSQRILHEGVTAGVGLSMSTDGALVGVHYIGVICRLYHLCSRSVGCCFVVHDDCGRCFESSDGHGLTIHSLQCDEHSSISHRFGDGTRTRIERTSLVGRMDGTPRCVVPGRGRVSTG